jgi:hypothetical protein
VPIHRRPAVSAIRHDRKIAEHAAPCNVVPGAPRSPPLDTGCRIGMSHDDQMRSNRPNWAEIATVFVVLAYTVVSCLQWRAIRESVAVTKHNLEVSQRAWVTGTGMADMNLADGAKAVVQFKNFGRTPATYFSAEVQLLSTGDPFPENPPYLVKEPLATATIGPEQDITQSVAFAAPLVADSENIRAGRRTLYFYGYAFYWDDFGVQRGLLFCGRYDPTSKGFNFCPTYNYPW